MCGCMGVEGGGGGWGIEPVSVVSLANNPERAIENPIWWR